jgi:hypothetical protein
VNRRKFLFTSATASALLAGGALYWPNRWKYIVVHHSAGGFGNIEFLQRVHRQRQAGDPLDAIPYHFVIGNGNGMKMGEVQSDWRQKYGLWGAHVSGRNFDHNFRGLGICLIGNFELHPVPEGQFTALVSLTRLLMSRYRIPVECVSGHGHTPGELTKCPGKLFPMDRFLAALS